MSINEKKESSANTAANISTPPVVEIKKEINSKYETEIIVGGKSRIIKKLKAGEFYEAQRAFAEILSSVTSSIDTDDIDVAQSKLDPNNPEQLKKIASKIKIPKVMEVIGSAPAKMAKFVAICAQMTEEELLKEAYPEEITDAFAVCYKLNNIAENLKKFGAPMRMLGAGLE